MSRGEAARRRRQDRLHDLEQAAIEAELETGRRETTVHKAKLHIVWRMARILAGTLVLVLGVILLPLPGPGWLVIAIGLTILSRDVPFAHRMLERVRARLPQDESGRIPLPVIAFMVTGVVLATAGSVWFTLIR